MATQKQMDEAIRLIMYRIYPPDGVWFDTDEREDIEEILWKLVEYTTPHTKNKFNPVDDFEHPEQIRLNKLANQLI